MYMGKWDKEERREREREEGRRKDRQKVACNTLLCPFRTKSTLYSLLRKHAMNKTWQMLQESVSLSAAEYSWREERSL